jgi:hypothetical protein
MILWRADMPPAWQASYSSHTRDFAQILRCVIMGQPWHVLEQQQFYMYVCTSSCRTAACISDWQALERLQVAACSPACMFMRHPLCQPSAAVALQQGSMSKLMFHRSFSCTRVASMGRPHVPLAGLGVGCLLRMGDTIAAAVLFSCCGFEQRAKAIASLAPS